VTEAISWAEWLENSKIAEGIRQSIYLYPIIETFHIIGFVILVGTALMFDVRLLGMSCNLSVLKLSQHLLPWSRSSLLIVIPTGILLFITNALSLANDNLFWIKMSLIILAGINAFVFHTNIFRSVSSWEIQGSTPILAKFHATFSIIVWISVIFCGRFLAY
jgi:hypothetical protein